MTGREKAERGPLKTWKVSVDQSEGVIFHARTAAKARYRAYEAFSECRHSVTFHEFLIRSTIWATKNNGRTGERVLVCGKPATLIEKPYNSGTYFMYDDSDVIMSAHLTEVAPLPSPVPGARE